MFFYLASSSFLFHIKHFPSDHRVECLSFLTLAHTFYSFPTRFKQFPSVHLILCFVLSFQHHVTLLSFLRVRLISPTPLTTFFILFPFASDSSLKSIMCCVLSLVSSITSHFCLSFVSNFRREHSTPFHFLSLHSRQFPSELPVTPIVFFASTSILPCRAFLLLLIYFSISSVISSLF